MGQEHSRGGGHSHGGGIPSGSAAANQFEDEALAAEGVHLPA
ncbi:hypothetical protein [Methylobacterium sp. C25]|nr:hypothetical protein [Methylobacterium sp. C25]